MSAIAHLALTAEDKTQAAFRSLKHSLSSVSAQLHHVKSELLAFAGITGFGMMIEGAIETGAEVEKLSKMLGASTESLSQFKHVAEVAHVSFESLTKSLRFMEKNVSLAALGTGTASNALKELGISATELKKLQPENQFEVIADAMTKVHNSSDKVRLAMQVFGKAGSEIIPIMEGGSKAIQAVRSEADKLGLTLNETSTHQLAQAHEAMIKLKTAFHGAANTLTITFAPALTLIADLITEYLPKSVNIAVRAFLRLKEIIALALSTVLFTLQKMYSVFGKFPGVVGKAFREGAQAAEVFQKKCFDAVTESEKALADLNHQHNTHHQHLQRIGKTFNDLYHPALKAMAEQHYRAAHSLKKLTTEEKAYQKWLQKGKEITLEMRTPREIYRDHLKEVNELLQKGAIHHQTYFRALKHYRVEFNENSGLTKRLQDQKAHLEAQVKTIADLFRNGLFAYLQEGFKGLVKSFENALSAMAADLAASEISKLLFGSLANSALQKGSGLLGQFLNDGFGKLFSFGSFGGFRAEGGAVFPGKGYIVGERGAELFIPKQSGTIISNEVLHKNNAPSIVMHIHTPDANSFRLSRSQITAEMGLALQRSIARNT